jgi:hypothetical protein
MCDASAPIVTLSQSTVVIGFSSTPSPRCISSSSGRYLTILSSHAMPALSTASTLNTFEMLPRRKMVSAEISGVLRSASMLGGVYAQSRMRSASWIDCTPMAMPVYSSPWTAALRESTSVAAAEETDGSVDGAVGAGSTAPRGGQAR